MRAIMLPRDRHTVTPWISPKRAFVTPSTCDRVTLRFYKSFKRTEQEKRHTSHLPPTRARGSKIGVTL